MSEEVMLREWDIKPCPFCGGEAFMVDANCGYSGCYYEYECIMDAIECEGCKVRMYGNPRKISDKVKVRSELIERWNRRAENEQTVEV